MNKVIWMLWDGGPPPYVVQQVHQSWKCLNPGWDVIVLDRGSLRRYMDAGKLKGTMSIQAKSDMIRLHVLNNHGGVWADSTMLCLRPLDSWIWPYLTNSNATKYFMFGQGFCSWFIASEAHSELTSRWVALADEYWSNRTVPSGNVGGVGNYRWLDGVLINYMRRDAKFKRAFESRPSLPCNGDCSPHMFYSKGCRNEVNMPLSPMIASCITSGNLPPAAKLTMHARCRSRAVDGGSVGTSGYELIQEATQRSRAILQWHSTDTSVSAPEAKAALGRAGSCRLWSRALTGTGNQSKVESYPPVALDRHKQRQRWGGLARAGYGREPLQVANQRSRAGRA